MPVNETVVEIVRFQAEGLDTIAARTKAFADETARAEQRQRALVGLLGNPAYDRHVRTVEAISRRTEQTTLALRNHQVAIQSTSGAYQNHVAIVTRLNRQHDLLQAKMKNASLARDLGSGAYLQHARDLAAINKEAESLGKKAQLADLVATHGRFGAVVRTNASELSALKRVGMAAYLGVAGAAVGLMRSGFAGTIEAHTLEMSWTRLSRSIAAIAIPAIDLLARTLGRVAGWFEGLTERQQNWVLGIGLAVVAAGPLVAVFRTVYGLVRGITAVWGTLRAAALLTAGTTTAAAVATTAAATTTAAVAATGGGAIAAGAGAGWLARALKGAGRVAIPVGVAAAATVALAESSDLRLHKDETSGEFMDRKRAEGRSAVGAFLDTTGMSLSVMWRNIMGGKEEFVGDKEKAEEKKRRDVTLADSSLRGLGDTNQMIQEELLKVSYERDGAMKEVAEAVFGVKELLEKWGARMDLPPMPGS